MLQYSVFFQICRAQYIGFNLKGRRGTMFTPLDSYCREHLGVMTMAATLTDAISLFGRALRMIHREISTPHMPGINNFQESIAELESVHGLVVDNISEHKETQKGKEEKKKIEDAGRAVRKTRESSSKWLETSKQSKVSRSPAPSGRSLRFQ
ncbi:unnamed protein product [Calicophoron daubneyi]|uniref:Uncharacterized protein n=1 Tax=Calicophoron daubneyi TaxID=300641 RepID=A0AAV2T0Q8_CALDB